MKAYDIQLTDAHDLLIANGDFVTDMSDERHIQHILIAEKGGYKNMPMVGVGIGNSINAPADELTRLALRTRIQLQLEYDGYTTIDFKLGTTQDGLGITINPETER
jgi:hypothetical protein